VCALRGPDPRVQNKAEVWVFKASRYQKAFALPTPWYDQITAASYNKRLPYDQERLLHPDPPTRKKTPVCEEKTIV